MGRGYAVPYPADHLDECLKIVEATGGSIRGTRRCQLGVDVLEVFRPVGAPRILHFVETWDAIQNRLKLRLELTCLHLSREGVGFVEAYDQRILAIVDERGKWTGRYGACVERVLIDSRPDALVPHRIRQMVTYMGSTAIFVEQIRDAWNIASTWKPNKIAEEVG